METQTRETQTPEVQTLEIQKTEPQTPEIQTGETLTLETQTPIAQTPEKQTPEALTPETPTPQTQTLGTQTLEALTYTQVYMSKRFLIPSSFAYTRFKLRFKSRPDSKVHGTNMGANWDRQDPVGPHVGSTNLVIFDYCPAERGILWSVYTLAAWVLISGWR